VRAPASREGRGGQRLPQGHPAPALEGAAVSDLHPGAPPGRPPPVDRQGRHSDGRRLPPEPGPRTVRPLGKRYHRWRSKRVERTFAHVCETGGARRTRLRGRANVEKRYLLQAARANLALVMRTLYGLWAPRAGGQSARRRRCGRFWVPCARCGIAAGPLFGLGSPSWVRWRLTGRREPI
jgi:hypothetical protein